MTDLSAEYLAGQIAHKNGEPVTENPYDFNSDLYAPWNAGWNNRYTSKSQPQTLSLEVGKTYENKDGDLFTVVADRREICTSNQFTDTPFVALDVADGEGLAFSVDGKNETRLPLIKEHTPPPEVNPVWVVVYPNGEFALRDLFGNTLNEESAQTLARGFNRRDRAVSEPAEVHKVQLTYGTGRRYND